MKCLAAAYAILFLTTCETVPLERFPAYDSAMKTPARGEPRCFDTNSTDFPTLPQLVPFAAITVPYDTHKEYAARVIGREAGYNKLYPEVVMLWEGGSYYPGSVPAASAVPHDTDALEFAFPAPTVKSLLVGVCCRLAPVRLGIYWDDAGRVTSIEDTALASGILKGDRIVSIAGAPVLVGAKWMQSPHYAKLLDLRAGTEVRLVWNRPGTGRKEGLLKLAANPPTYLQAPGAIASSLDTIATNHL
jgi:hypothetical protein